MSIRGDILSELAGALAELYAHEGSIPALATTAGLGLGQTPFYPRAIDTWVFVLQEAEAQGRTQVLLDEAKRQYPVEEHLQAASQAYAEWVAAGRPPTQPLRPQPLSSITEVEVPPAGGEPSSTKRRAWPWVAAGLLVVVLLVLVIATVPGSMRGSPPPLPPTSIPTATAIPTSTAVSKVPCPGRNNVEMSEELQIEVRDGYVAYWMGWGLDGESGGFLLTINGPYNGTHTLQNGVYCPPLPAHTEQAKATVEWLETLCDKSEGKCPHKVTLP